MTCPTCDDVLGAIEGLIEDNGYSPTLREVAGATWYHLTTVRNHLFHLRETCRISFEDRKPRTIRILEEAS